MAAAMMAARRGRRTSSSGADRIAANGDVANKIGTYAPGGAGRASTACPFFVAAPTSTRRPLDARRRADIPIEERAAEEVRGLSLFGRRGRAGGRRGGQPGLRRHAGAPRDGDRHRARRAPAALRALAVGAVAAAATDRRTGVPRR